MVHAGETTPLVVCWAETPNSVPFHFRMDRPESLAADCAPLVAAPPHGPVSVSGAVHRRWLKPLAYTLLLTLATVGLMTALPIKSYSQQTMLWIQLHHVEGALLLPVLFCVTIPFNIPSTMFEILAGSVFGMLYGVVLSVIGKTIATVVAFKLGQRFGKDRLGSYLEANFPSFTAMSSVLESESWKPLLLIQVSSLPYVMKCYGLAVTEVTTYRFTVSSLLGGIPYAVVWAYIGLETKDIFSDRPKGATPMDSSQLALMVVGSLFTVVAMVVLVVYTRQQLQTELQLRAQQNENKVSVNGDKDSDEHTALVVSDSSVVTIAIES